MCGFIFLIAYTTVTVHFMFVKMHCREVFEIKHTQWNLFKFQIIYELSYVSSLAGVFLCSVLLKIF